MSHDQDSSIKVLSRIYNSLILDISEIAKCCSEERSNLNMDKCLSGRFHHVISPTDPKRKLVISLEHLKIASSYIKEFLDEKIQEGGCEDGTRS